jgi:hypothetical protein
MKRKFSRVDEIHPGAAFITTEDEGVGNSDEGGDDLATLFSKEDIEAKRTAISESKAEEDRRAALTDEERTLEDTTRAEETAAKGVPEKYDFKIPEGTTIDDEIMGEVSAFAKENNLPMKEAQRIADLGAKMLVKQQESRMAEYETIKEGWLTSAKTDKEIGADISKGKDSIAARAFNTIATPEMKEMVDQYGIGNHPEVLRMFYRLAPFMADDKMHMPGSGAGAGSSTGVESTVAGIFNHPSRKQG